MGITSVIGHSGAIDFLLRSAREGRLSHSYLFTGPKGIGKFTVASEFARFLACSDPTPDGDYCDICDSCRKATPDREFGMDLHPDILIFEPAVRGTKQREKAASIEKQQTPIESIREIGRTAHFPPVYASKRIFIVPQAETMSPAAASALLKTLEEPPPTAMIILISPSEGQLLPTLVSRCQVLPFHPVPTEELTAALVARMGLDEMHARGIARIFEGRPGHAIEALSDPEYIATRAAFSKIMEKISEPGNADLLEITDTVCFRLRGQIAKGTAGGDDDDKQPTTGVMRGRADMKMASAFAEFAAAWYRDVLAARLGEDDLIINQDLAGPLRAAAHHLSLTQSARYMAIMMRAKQLIEANINPQLVLDSSLIRCTA